FPLAAERGIAVLVYAPFGRTRLWEQVEGRQVPDWAAEYDIATWGQFFLKFVVSHPAVTAATPATSNPKHLVDNMGAAMGPLPDQAARQRMIEHIESLGRSPGAGTWAGVHRPAPERSGRMPPAAGAAHRPRPPGARPPESEWPRSGSRCDAGLT